MNGNNLVIDTNIILYLLGGDKTIAELLFGKDLYVSFITEIELLSFKHLNHKEEKEINLLLQSCTVIDINAEIKKLAITIRSKYNLKIPDAIIAATAVYYNCPFMTADVHLKKIEDVDIWFFDKSEKL